jgi:hypothetical protein
MKAFNFLIIAPCLLPIFSATIRAENFFSDRAENVFSEDGTLLFPLVCVAEKYTVSTRRYPSRTNPNEIAPAFFKPDGQYKGGPGGWDGRIVLTRRRHSDTDVVLERYSFEDAYLDFWTISMDGTTAMSAHLTNDMAKAVVWNCVVER